MATQTEFLVYFSEFRQRLIYCVILFVITFSCMLYYSNQLYTLLALPLLNHLPLNQTLIATDIASAFFVPCQFAFTTAVTLAMPYFLFQFWSFISPALYQNERKMLWPILWISTALFYCGIAFAYFIIFPMIFHFLVNSAPNGVTVNPDITCYLDFTLKLFLIFGLTFEIPVVTTVLVVNNIISQEKLILMRPYIIVSAFVIGMLLAPPDVISQTIFAIPFWLLFEVGIVLSRFFAKTPRKQYDN